MKRFFIAIGIACIALMAASFCFVLWGMWSSTDESKKIAQEVCMFAQSGKTVDEIKAFATQKGCKISVSTSGNESILAIKPQTGADMRYYRCMVYFTGQKVARSELSTYNPR